MTSSKNWKKSEKLIADVLDTERTPFSGSTSGLTSADTLHENLFVEVKTKKKHSVKTLYDSTVKLAAEEGKIPLIILRENDSDEILWVLEQKYVFQILQEIDLHSINKKLSKGTTVTKLLDTQNMSQGGQGLHMLKKGLDRQIDEIVMGKILTKENKQILKGLAVLSYYIESIMEFQTDEEG